jgi:hypothetical protein
VTLHLAITTLLSDKKRQDEVGNFHIRANIFIIIVIWLAHVFDFIVFQLENLIKE